MNRYRCSKCPYVYDPQRGDPDGGIPPGTPFDRIPNSWRCPICGATKRDFYPLTTRAPNAPIKPARVPAQAQAQVAAPVAAPAASRPAGAGPPARPGGGWTVGPLKRIP